MMKRCVGNFDNVADQHNSSGKNKRIHQNGSAVLVLKFQMKKQEKYGEDEREQCRIKQKAVGKMSAEKCDERTLHAAAGTIHSRQ